MTDNVDITLLQRQVVELEERFSQQPISAGPGDSGGNDMWQQSVETRLGQLHEDLRSHLKYMLIGLGAALTFWLGSLVWADQKFDRIDARLDSIDQKLILIIDRVGG